MLLATGGHNQWPLTPDANAIADATHTDLVAPQTDKADSTGTATATFTADAHLGGDHTVVVGSLPAAKSTNWARWSLLIMAMNALILGVRRYAV